MGSRAPRNVGVPRVHIPALLGRTPGMGEALQRSTEPGTQQLPGDWGRHREPSLSLSVITERKRGGGFQL